MDNGNCCIYDWIFHVKALILRGGISIISISISVFQIVNA